MKYTKKEESQALLPVANAHSAPETAKHFVYVLSCADGTLYTGYTTDVTRRLATHNAGKGARYTRGRRPVVLLAQWAFAAKGDALRAERAIKLLPREEKLRLVQRAQEEQTIHSGDESS